MQTYCDNFLSDTEFATLNNRMLWRFKPTLKQDTDPKDYQACRIRTTSDNNDYTEAAILLGKSVPSVVDKVRNYLIKTHQFINPEANGIWFQYMNNKQIVGKHYDNSTIRGRKPTQCFSTFLYTHIRWDDDWGGELCFHSTCILPKSNRLIIYSRDEEHWVSEIKHDQDEYQRMFLGMSWSTDNDF